MPRSIVRRVSVVFLLLCAVLSPLSVTPAFAQSGTLTCDDFTNQDAAQIVLDFDDEFADALDEDGDGEACPDLPAASGSSSGSSGDVELVIGGDIDDLEEGLGAPEDDADEDDFSVGTEYAGFGDFETVNIFWLNDTAAHISVELADQIALDDAFDLAVEMFPSDVVAEEDGETLDDGSVLHLGESDEVADLFTDADYEEFEVGGSAGDVRIILVPGQEGITQIDVAIGVGDEFAGAGNGGNNGGSTDGTDDPVDADTEEYLTTVRDAQTTMAEDIIAFTELISNAASWTDADIDDLVDILTRWSALEADAATLDVPDGMEDIQATYEDAAAALADVSLNLTAFLTENDEAALDQAFASLGEASALITELDTLLTDAGA
jgi:hypothetical protein